MSRASQPDKQNGTLSVHTIKASGHIHRTNRPNTRLHPTTTPKHQINLAMREPSTQDIGLTWAKWPLWRKANITPARRPAGLVITKTSHSMDTDLLWSEFVYYYVLCDSAGFTRD